MLDVYKQLTVKFPKLRFGFDKTQTNISVSNETFYKNVRRDVHPDLSKQEYANIWVEMIKELNAK